MINPFDYLFYKLTIFMDYTEVYSPEAHSPALMGLIFSFNTWTILNIVTDELNNVVYMLLAFIPFLAVMIIYNSDQRCEKIEAKYEDELDNQRILGNWLVFLYVAATIGLYIWSFRFIPVNN